MNYYLDTTRRFERQLRRFTKKHPDLKGRIDQVFQDLQEDPFQPQLELHALRGQLEGLHAARIDYANRLILTLRLDEGIIVLVDIGSHDEVYR